MTRLPDDGKKYLHLKLQEWLPEYSTDFESIEQWLKWVQEKWDTFDRKVFSDVDDFINARAESYDECPYETASEDSNESEDLKESKTQVASKNSKENKTSQAQNDDIYLSQAKISNLINAANEIELGFLTRKLESEMNLWPRTFVTINEAIEEMIKIYGQSPKYIYDFLQQRLKLLRQRAVGFGDQGYIYSENMNQFKNLPISQVWRK